MSFKIPRREWVLATGRRKDGTKQSLFAPKWVSDYCSHVWHANLTAGEFCFGGDFYLASAMVTIVEQVYLLLASLKVPRLPTCIACMVMLAVQVMHHVHFPIRYPEFLEFSNVYNTKN
jgi:hypothetical protein